MRGRAEGKLGPDRRFQPSWSAIFLERFGHVTHPLSPHVLHHICKTRFSLGGLQETAETAEDLLNLREVSLRPHSHRWITTRQMHSASGGSNRAFYLILAPNELFSKNALQTVNCAPSLECQLLEIRAGSGLRISRDPGA